MTRAKRPIISLLITLLALVATGAIIFFVPPTSSVVEMGMLILLGITLFLGSSWVIGNTKRGAQVALGIIGLLVMHRLHILNLPTLGLWLIVVGLISLIN